VVHSERFDDNPEEAMITTTWVERDGVTTMTVVMRFSSQAVRDMVVATGMESGAAESYDNLAALVAGQ
jgi:activator of Hsp90 ATPase-like protein